MPIIASTEDNGSDEFQSPGIRIPLGPDTTTRNNLTTTCRPGLAAAWASAFD
ncbi:MAG: hypothetical protein U1E06_14320 [Tabrizicola sp.]|uniref:hypothetical protein n=1 Tax=Tabrizicola sp. TaxID=2005166 RepID=UPI00273513CF|nr:hypothetical protein [Tabrizicola sp.]MDP3263761.1 hypothetical protein [Tabrizicola sp.]MDP3647125.1 hypothetical protein [Paracoccaceae bacterium]MDZ4067999.1 hypothetical protein [Tabrizicola sp.]